MSMISYYKAVIGQKAQQYYLDQFAKFDGKRWGNATWHWSAFFVTLPWLLYRKLYFYAAGYFILLNLFLFEAIKMWLFGNSVTYSYFRPGVFVSYVVISLFIPMYANKIYYQNCRRKISTARRIMPDVKSQLTHLSAKGGTSVISVLFVTLSYVVTIGAIGMLFVEIFHGMAYLG